MILPAIQEIILDNAGVTALIEGRIRVGNLEQGEYRPSVDMRIVKDRPTQYLQGGIIMHRSIITIDCLAESPLVADNVHRAIENCGLIGYQGNAGSVHVDGVVCIEAYEQDYETPYPASDKRRYVSCMTLEVCWH